MSKKYTIICDTREQLPIIWRESSTIAGTIRQKLDSGDYSILGLENVVTVERKGSAAEFAKNVLEDRFYRELERLNTQYKYVFLILEFSQEELEGYPYKSKIPPKIKKRIRIRGSFLLKKIIEIQKDYPNIQLIFCEIGAKQLIEKIFNIIYGKTKKTKS